MCENYLLQLIIIMCVVRLHIIIVGVTRTALHFFIFVLYSYKYTYNKK